ncbi:MAG: ABC transporter permease [Anaerolineae bacterium]|jgi:putative ABC transport system permease protein
MAFPWLLALAWRELWVRRGRTLLSLLALALGVGLVTATGALGALLRANVDRPAPLVGRPADLWVHSAYDADYDLPPGLSARVAAVAGVAGVQPVLRRPIRIEFADPEAPGVRADNLTLLGVDLDAYLSFHDLALAAGQVPTPREPGWVALAPWAAIHGLRPGQPITLTRAVAPGPALPLVGLLEVDSLASAQQGLVLYAPRETAAALLDLDGAPTAIEVRLASGANPGRVRAALEAELGAAYAVTSAARPDLHLWGRLVLGTLLAVDLLALLGSASLIYAVFAAAGRTRRRQIGLLRAAGATRRQVLALLLAEAGLLGLVGSGLGLLLGLLFARAGAALVLPQAEGPAAPPLSIGRAWSALALGLAVALAGALAPALRAARLPPVAALRHLPLPPPAPVGSLPPAAARLAGRLPGAAALAAANLGRERGRAALIVAALALVLASFLGSLGALSLLGQEMATTLGRLSGGDYLVLPGLSALSLPELAGQDTSSLPPLSPGLLAALDHLGGQAWLMRGTTADLPALEVFAGQPTLLLDVEGYARMGGFRFQAGDWTRALAAFERGPAVLLTPVVARRLGVALGDALPLQTVRGPVDFVVAGIGDSEFTTCILDLADGQAYLGANEANALMVKVRPGADPAAVRQALADAVRRHGGTLLSLEQASAQLRHIFDQARLSIALLVGVSGLVAILGVVNTLLSSVAGRRREIGLFRAVGATRRQVAHVILLEAALLGLAAALLGIFLGWVATLGAWLLARDLLGLTGQAVSSPGAWLPLATASLAALLLWPLLAAAGALAPARYAARLPVIQALQGLDLQ